MLGFCGGGGGGGWGWGVGVVQLFPSKNTDQIVIKLSEMKVNNQQYMSLLD